MRRMPISMAITLNIIFILAVCSGVLKPVALVIVGINSILIFHSISKNKNNMRINDIVKIKACLIEITSENVYTRVDALEQLHGILLKNDNYVNDIAKEVVDEYGNVYSKDQLNQMMLYHLNKTKDELDDSYAILKYRINRILHYEEYKKSQLKKTAYLLCAILSAGVVIYLAWFFIGPKSKYTYATKAYTEGRFEDALELYTKSKDYKNSNQMIQSCMYNIALEKIESSDYESARPILEELGSYENSENELIKCIYNIGKGKLNNSDYAGAIEELSQVSSYADSSELIRESNYKMGILCMDNAQNSDAVKYLNEASGYKDSYSKLVDIAFECIKNNHSDEAFSIIKSVPHTSEAKYRYINGLNYLEEKNYVKASEEFANNSTLDANKLYYESSYMAGVDFYNHEEYEDAISMFECCPEYEDALDYLQKAQVFAAVEKIKITDFESAESLLENLPQDLTLEGYSVAVLKKTIQQGLNYKNKLYDSVAFSGYLKSIKRTSTQEEWWEINIDDAGLPIGDLYNCTKEKLLVDDDLNFSISVAVEFHYFSGYSDSKDTMINDYYRKKEKQTTVPANSFWGKKIQFDDATWLTVNENSTILDYEWRGPSDNGATYIYKTHMVFE